MKKRAFFGLGNPGREYALTRHNVGYRIVEALALALEAPPFRSHRYVEMTELDFRGIRWYLFRPTTYMNRSGDAVAYWQAKLALDYSELIVILDEIQLPLGRMRLTPQGAAGGHNGLAHVIERLGRIDFPRLRIGIGRHFPRGKQVEYVLSPFSPNEEAVFQSLIPRAIDCLMTWAIHGIDQAMNTCNQRLSTLSPISSSPDFA
ncbi:MAG: aminoacyl-tRNA hydrolase [Bacteroidia bacterium]|nr:aminoacyl-tRNA hydrolase [Bacteroidia bacterium]MDW8015042.1 aminoacyl-tRNA hydrolase [Bacteroidia bacterium]